MSQEYLFDSDSDDEICTNMVMQSMLNQWEVEADDEKKKKHGGSSSSREYIRRNRKVGEAQLWKDYFGSCPTYNADKFRRRFRMRLELFNRILHDVVTSNKYFQQRVDTTGALGLSSHVKLTAASRMLAYGIPADALDDLLRIGESTCIETLKQFCRSIQKLYAKEYLRSPTPADLVRLKRKAEARGFPGMLGSLDCMHWEWKNCPTAHHGSYVGHFGHPTIILEAVASYDTWIWHAFFGMPGSNNDLNVLYASPLFDDVLNGRSPPCDFEVNGVKYNQSYYLADGIYPKWANIVQTISQPQGQMRKLFAKRQEAYRKDVERAFGVLQARFAILRGPARSWHQEDLAHIMNTCIILHNMIVKDERDEYESGYDDDPRSCHPSPFYYEDEGHIEPIHLQRDSSPLESYLVRRKNMRDSIMHHGLREDIISHLWKTEGNKQ